MGKIQFDHTGSGGGITLSSDGTNLLLDGSAVGGGGGGSAFDTPEVKTANWSVSNSDKGKVFVVDTDNLTLTLPQYSTLDDDWFIRIYTKGDGIQPSYGNPGDLTIDPQYSTYSGRVNGNTNWVMKSRQGGLLFKDPEQSNNFIFDTHSTNWDIDINSTTNANRANATGWGSVAILGQATASGTNSISIGYLATASGTDAIAIGSNSANASGTDSIAIGHSLANSTDAVAIGIDNNTTTYGATGTASFAAGYRAKSSGTRSTALGYYATAQGTGGVAIGGYAYGAKALGTYGIAIGDGCSAASGATAATVIGWNNSTASTAVNSIVLGSENQSVSIAGKISYGPNHSPGSGVPATKAKAGIQVLTALTTDATSTTMTTPKTTGQESVSSSSIIGLDNNTSFTFSILITARQKASEGTAAAAWKLEGLARREGSASTVTLVSSSKTILSNAPSWDVAIAANTSAGGLNLNVTGAASTNIYWSANVNTAEVTYA